MLERERDKRKSVYISYGCFIAALKSNRPYTLYAFPFGHQLHFEYKEPLMPYGLCLNVPELHFSFFNASTLLDSGCKHLAFCYFRWPFTCSNTFVQLFEYFLTISLNVVYTNSAICGRCFISMQLEWSVCECFCMVYICICVSSFAIFVVWIQQSGCCCCCIYKSLFCILFINLIHGCIVLSQLQFALD